MCNLVMAGNDSEKVRMIGRSSDVTFALARFDNNNNNNNNNNNRVSSISHVAASCSRHRDSFNCHYSTSRRSRNDENENPLSST